MDFKPGRSRGWRSEEGIEAGTWADVPLSGQGVAGAGWVWWKYVLEARVERSRWREQGTSDPVPQKARPIRQDADSLRE